MTVTATVCPLATVAPLKVLPSTIKEPPLLTVMDAAASMPLTVMASLVTAVPGATPVLAVKVNASGVVSAASMVMVTVSVPLKSPSLTVNVNVSVVLAATIRRGERGGFGGRAGQAHRGGCPPFDAMRRSRTPPPGRCRCR